MIYKVNNESELNDLLSLPADKVVAMMKRLDGDIIILGVAGKMGVTLAMTAVKAIIVAGVTKKVIGVARFSDPKIREMLDSKGVETIKCDLLEREEVVRLPQCKNIIYMAGRKFGTGGSEELTWAMNTVIPVNILEHFSASRVVAFSTGCVYPLAKADSAGLTEDVKPEPIGEYAQSCLGRERVFQYFAKHKGIDVCLYRLNYAIDLRYGVLHDIAIAIYNNEPVDITSPCFNIIWQKDANNTALLCLEHCSSPANIMNVTGMEKLDTKKTALLFGELFGREVLFKGESSGYCYLNNAAKSKELFNEYSVNIDEMIQMQADWILAGGKSLNKPTHFEVNNGKF